MKLLYFSWIRERVGISEEVIELPEHVETVSDLLEWLRSRGPQFKNALTESSKIRVAVDHVHSDHDKSLENAREVAIFPPMTGG